MKLNNLIGQRFGRLTVISKSHKQMTHWFWKCLCDCGTETIVQGNNLRNGHSKSCGCLRSQIVSQRSLISLTGRIFGKLTVIEKADLQDGISGDAHSQWRCYCECGNTTVTSSRFLLSGHTKSCGCLRKNNGTLYVVGANHPNWKGGISSENRRIRNSADFKYWREAVFKRDKWTCQKCGRKRRLHPHHIKAFALYPELRFAVDNGITYCETCHVSYHTEERINQKEAKKEASKNE